MCPDTKIMYISRRHYIENKKFEIRHSILESLTDAFSCLEVIYSHTLNLHSLSKLFFLQSLRHNQLQRKWKLFLSLEKLKKFFALFQLLKVFIGTFHFWRNVRDLNFIYKVNLCIQKQL